MWLVTFYWWCDGNNQKNLSFDLCIVGRTRPSLQSNLPRILSKLNPKLGLKLKNYVQNRTRGFVKTIFKSLN